MKTTTTDKKNDYEEMIDDARRRIHYPVYLTTDGYTFDLEHQLLDGQQYDGIIIGKISTQDDYPSFAETTRCRILVKRGVRGDALKHQIYDATWID